MYCNHDLHFKAFSIFGNYQATKQIVILTWQIIFWMLFQKADSKQAVPQLNQSIAVTQQMLQACLQHQPAPLQHHNEEETQISTTYSREFHHFLWIKVVYIYMGMCFEPGWSKADQWMLNSFTVVLFWKCPFEQWYRTVSMRRDYNPRSTGRLQAGRVTTELFNNGVHNLYTAEATSQTERLGSLFKALRKGSIKWCSEEEATDQCQRLWFILYSSSLWGLHVTFSTWEGPFLLRTQSPKVSCKLLPSFRCLKILQQCTDFNSIQVWIMECSGNEVLPLVFTSLLRIIHVFSWNELNFTKNVQ